MSHKAFNDLMAEGRSERIRELEESRDALAAAADALKDQRQEYANIIAECVGALRMARDELCGPPEGDSVLVTIAAIEAALAAAALEGFDT